MTSQPAAIRDAGARLRELDRLGVVRDEPDLDLDIIARAAAAVVEAPIGFVSLLGEHRLCFRTTQAQRVMPDVLLIASFCVHTLDAPGEVFVVRDALTDARFRDHAIVTGTPFARAYAGAPLVTSRGIAIGALCVLDTVPRNFSDAQCSALRTLARLCLECLEHTDPHNAPERAQAFGLPAPTSAALVRCDAGGGVTGWSAGAEHLTGITATDALARNVFPEPDRTRFAADCREVVNGGADVSQRYRLTTHTGAALTASMTLTRVDAGVGEPIVVATISQVAGRTRGATRAAMFETALVHAADAVLIVAPAGDAVTGPPIVYANAAFTRLTGVAATHVIGRPVNVILTDAANTDGMTLAEALLHAEPAIVEAVVGRPNGRAVRIEWSISPIRDENDGSLLHSVIVGRDITARHAFNTYEDERSTVLEMAIRNAPLSEQLERIVVLLRDVIASSIGTVMLVDDGKLQCAAADPRMPRAFLTGVEGVVIGPNVGTCGKAVATCSPVFCPDITTDDAWRGYQELALAAGLRSCWSIPLLSAEDTPIGAFALYRPMPGTPSSDERRWLEETARFAALVIDRHRDHERLRHLAMHDCLTGLPNRRAIERAVADAIDESAGTGRGFALALLDIDRFKMVNDAFGHHVGDRLLQAISERLRSVLGGRDTLGRSGGDEFVIVMRDNGDDVAALGAARNMLAAFEAPFLIDGFEIAVRGSMGVALHPQTATGRDDLFITADHAMFAAKARGGGVEIASPIIASTAMRSIDLDHDLPHTLERGQLALRFQTIFDIGDGRTAGAEALLRWQHPRFGLLEPSDFIPLAEANSTILAIGSWVLREAVAAAARWQRTGHRRFLTVNVSALQFEAPDFVSTVTAALAHTRLEPALLHLELTETLIMRNPAACNATLLALKDLGVKVVIDDFGTGYSSLAYLQRFAFDALKVDRSFVRDIGVEPPDGRSERVVAAVMNIGRALDVAAIAEGVETRRQLAFVKACGCAYMQGFYGSRPVAEPAIDWDARIDVASTA